MYVNYGLLEDYEQLERYGIDVAGKIVIVRYGYAFRAIKPKLAAERGAIGCLIYSDPSDDGYVVGEAYPEGPYKNDSAVQRGSIKYTPLYAGDPLTPGWAATADAERLDIKESKSLATIPTLPLSYGDALPLLDAIEGPVAPPEWRGGLPITYRIGPGPATVRLQLAFDWNTVTAQNVIAKREGAVWPDQWGDPGQPPRRLEPRRAGSRLRPDFHARGGEGDLDACHSRRREPSCSPPGTRRNRVSWVPPSGWRNTATNSRRRLCSTSIRTATAAVSCVSAAVTHSKSSSTRCSAT